MARMNLQTNPTETNRGDGHRRRLRQKFLESGLSGFHDYEILELLLTLNTPRRDCKPSAKALLKRFKTLQGVFDASASELQTVDGVGPQNCFGLLLIKQVADRYLEKKIINRTVISNSSDLVAYLNVTMGHRSREAFCGIFLDARNRVLATEILFEGTLTSSAVYPREVIVKALEHRAAAMIFAHNHPSGDPSPSREDLNLTRKLLLALGHVGIRVHEHVIVGGDSCYSFADQGMIAEFNRELDGHDRA